TVDGGIPVELLNFTASLNGTDVTLNWGTASETNNRGFEIQKSEIKSQSEWKTIGFVDGKGNTTERQSYSFTEKNPEPGNYLYRLKQIDFDGSFEYSSEIEVNVAAPLVFSLFQNYPNPFNPETKIIYEIPSYAEVNTVQLKIFDVLGNEVEILINEEQMPGKYEVTFDASNHTSGIYFYNLKAGSFSETKKMILMR